MIFTLRMRIKKYIICTSDLQFRSLAPFVFVNSPALSAIACQHSTYVGYIIRRYDIDVINSHS